MLTPDRWKRVEQLFDEALALQAEDRPAFVAQQSGSDPELGRELESLLAADARPDAGEALMGEAAAAWASSGDDDSLVGRDIDGYRVIALLGAGGMGEVYLAEDRELDRKIALKLLPAAFTSDAGRLRRFADEARAASALNHPNILTVYQIGEIAGRRFIATEFIDGETLRDRIARGPLPLAEAFEIGVQVTRALAAAHNAGLVHRDIKPENIMIRRDGYVKVLDFGLAKLADSVPHSPDQRPQTRAGAIVGTIDYMAPEQATGQAVDARADLYSLAVVLHEMITGVLPRELGSGSAAAASAPAVLRLLQRGVASDRERRYQTAGDLQRDLIALQQHGQGPSSRVRALRWAAAAAVVVVVAGALALTGRPDAPPTGIHSLVVMPLRSLAADGNQAYLEHGLAEAILTRLVAVPQLRVPPSAAVKPGEDPFDAGRRLSVDAVLTGSVQRLGDQLRVTVQIARVADRTQIWAGRFDERFTDIFRVEDTIAERVVSTLLPTVTAQQRAALTRRETPSAEAYDLYLRGREQWSRRTVASIRTAVKMFEEAIALDPNFALAYTGLADCYNLTASGLPPADRFPRAKAAAEKALALDPKLGAAHTAMAFTLYKFEWNMPEAEREFRRAVELDPRYALAHHWFGEFLKLLGRHDESIQEFRRAVELDPFSIPVRYDFILALLSAGQTANARAVLDESIAIDPNALRVVRASADVLFAEGRVDEAVDARLREYRIFGVPESDVTALLSAYRSGGHRQLLLTRASQLLAAMPNGPSGPTRGLSTTLAQIYADLRDRENTLFWVTKAADLGEDAPLLLKTRAFLFLQDDPRYLVLTRRVGFTAAD